MLDRLEKAETIAATGWWHQANRPHFNKMPDGETVELFYLFQTASVEHLQQAAVHIRQLTGARRLFTYSPLRAIVVKGSKEQLAATRQRLALEQ